MLQFRYEIQSLNFNLTTLHSAAQLFMHSGPLKIMFTEIHETLTLVY